MNPIVYFCFLFWCSCSYGARTTGQPSIKPTKAPFIKPTRQPTSTPTTPSSMPTSYPTQPTSRPTSSMPTGQPTGLPTSFPTSQPSGKPSSQPTRQPTQQPTGQPTRQPTGQPSRQPTSQPTRQPTRQPTSQPTSQPTNPTNQPTGQPSRQPTASPSESDSPTSRPTSTSAPSYSLAPTYNRVYIYSTWTVENVLQGSIFASGERALMKTASTYLKCDVSSLEVIDRSFSSAVVPSYSKIRSAENRYTVSVSTKATLNLFDYPYFKGNGVALFANFSSIIIQKIMNKNFTSELMANAQTENAKALLVGGVYVSNMTTKMENYLYTVPASSGSSSDSTSIGMVNIILIGIVGLLVLMLMMGVGIMCAALCKNAKVAAAD